MAKRKKVLRRGSSRTGPARTVAADTFGGVARRVIGSRNGSSMAPASGLRSGDDVMGIFLTFRSRAAATCREGGGQEEEEENDGQDEENCGAEAVGWQSDRGQRKTGSSRTRRTTRVPKSADS